MQSQGADVEFELLVFNVLIDNRMKPCAMEDKRRWPGGPHRQLGAFDQGYAAGQFLSLGKSARIPCSDDVADEGEHKGPMAHQFVFDLFEPSQVYRGDRRRTAS